MTFEQFAQLSTTTWPTMTIPEWLSLPDANDTSTLEMVAAQIFQPGSVATEID